MKLKDIKGVMLGEKNQHREYFTAVAEAFDDGFNEALTEQGKVEVEMDVTKVEELFNDYEWITFEGATVLAIHPDVIAKVLSDNLPSILVKKC